MATIIINAGTHRSACTDALGEQDLAAYDAHAKDFFDGLAEVTKAAGFGFEVDNAGSGAASYCVTGEADSADLESAHLFMQSPQADFWGWHGETSSKPRPDC